MPSSRDLRYPGIEPTSLLCLLHCRQIFYCLSDPWNEFHHKLTCFHPQLHLGSLPRVRRADKDHMKLWSRLPLGGCGDLSSTCITTWPLVVPSVEPAEWMSDSCASNTNVSKLIELFIGPREKKSLEPFGLPNLTFFFDNWTFLGILFCTWQKTSTVPALSYSLWRNFMIKCLKKNRVLNIQNALALSFGV